MQKQLEEWKQIEGYGGKYLISNRGRVKNTYVDRFLGKYKKTIRIPKDDIVLSHDNGNGYEYVTLSIKGKKKNHYVHRLVATAFLEKEEGRKVVNHKDFNKKNNNVDNLEWCTQSENVTYSKPNMIGKHKAGRTGERYIHIKDSGYVVNIDRLGVYKQFKNIDDAIKYRDEVCI